MTYRTQPILLVAMSCLTMVLVALVVIDMQKPLYVSLPEILVVPVVYVIQAVPVAETVLPDVPGVHLKIPIINVDAVIKDMGVTAEGAMAVPGNRVDVGWYSLGTRPGQMGSAVIGGHNVWKSGAGAFARLDELKKGDLVSVVDAKGEVTAFVVRDMHTYDATDTKTGIFASKSGAHLNLITCSGAWDSLTKSYTKRLVVFTDVV
jgi:LPXTG-site transpeptidase (sortase) family protein